MIKGTGVDIVNVPRITKLINEHGSRFLEKILSPEEIEKMPSASREHYAAGRFAAKEALVKAAGTLFSFSGISVLNTDDGKPFFSGGITDQNASDEKIHLTISHDTDYAAAFVIIEKG